MVKDCDFVLTLLFFHALKYASVRPYTFVNIYIQSTTYNIVLIEYYYIYGERNRESNGVLDIWEIC